MDLWRNSHFVTLQICGSVIVRRALRGICVALSALSFLGMARAQDLNIAVSLGPVSLPIYVAESQGYFEREGIAVRLTECSSGRSCFQLLAQKQTDLATAAELLVTLDSFTGSDVAIIAILSSSTNAIKLVARRGAGIKSPNDLRGKRLATVFGTSAQYFLDQWLVFHEIDPKLVVLVPLAPDQLAGALQRHDVDAIAIWDPIASTAVAALAQDAMVLSSPRVYTQHFGLIANRQTIGRREADLVKLLRSLARAEHFIAEHPIQAMHILNTRLARNPGPETLLEYDFKLTLDQSLITTMDGQARWATREGIAPHGGTPRSLLKSIEPALLRKAVPDAVNLVQ